MDPLVTLLISGYLFVQTFTILKEAFEILMQMSPSGMDTERVGQAVSILDGIHGIHHIHIWKLSDKRIHFEAHIELEQDLPVSATHEIRKKIREKLRTEFGIDHTTLQFEYRIKDLTRHDHEC